MKNGLTLFFLCLICVFHMKAITAVDGLTGQPLPKASIFDSKGKIIGISSDKGLLPYISPECFPISVCFLGYESAVVTSPLQNNVTLFPVSTELPEIIVDSKKKQVLYLKGCVREYSSMITNSDTVFLYREKNVDFMVPVVKNKHFTGWTLPRLLSSKSYYHFTDNSGLDSVSDYYNNHFSWSDWIGILTSATLPEKLKNKVFANDTVRAKYGISSIWQKKDDDVSLNIDILSTEENRKWVPGISHFLNKDIDFTLFDLRYDFCDVNEQEVRPDNIARISYNIQANGNNRNINRLGNRIQPVYMDTYAEIYITSREYISFSEASKIEKRLKEHITEEKSEMMPELMASIQDLIERVNNTDNEMERLQRATDKKIGGRELKGEKYKHGVLPFISRTLKKLGFQF